MHTSSKCPIFFLWGCHFFRNKLEMPDLFIRCCKFVVILGYQYYFKWRCYLVQWHPQDIVSHWNGLILKLELGTPLYVWHHVSLKIMNINPVDVCLFLILCWVIGLAYLTSHVQYLLYAESSFSTCHTSA